MLVRDGKPVRILHTSIQYIVIGRAPLPVVVEELQVSLTKDKAYVVCVLRCAFPQRSRTLKNGIYPSASE